MFDESHIEQVKSLESVPTGVELANALAAIDLATVTAAGRVEVWRAHQRLIAHYQALSYRDMAAVEDHFLSDGDSETMAFEGAAAEFQICGMLTRHSAEGEQAFAEALWRRLPQVGQALVEGRIDVRRARTFVRGTEHLAEDTARAVVNELIELASELTTSQLAGRIQRRCIESNPTEARDRYQRAVDERRVVSNLSPQGTANFHIIDGPPDKVAAASRLVDWIAKDLKRCGDKRPIDQIRVDAALDLLTATTNANHLNQSPAKRRGTNQQRVKRLGGVHIATDLVTLTRLKDHPGDLAGYGPVIADMARQTTDQQRNTPWEFTVTDPATGEIIATGTTRRRPTASQHRRARAEHTTCIFPGCQMPAIDCDLDHRAPWRTTHRTQADDLYPACRHDHRIRHDHNWTYRPLSNGQIEFTTRLGHKYTTTARGP